MSWVNKTKTEADAWIGKVRITTMTERGRILTPDNNQILVGANKDEVLIWQAASDAWNRKIKISV